MPEKTFDGFIASLENLIAQERYGAIAKLTHSFFSRLQTQSEYSHILALFRKIPSQVIHTEFLIARNYAELLCAAQEFEALAEFIGIARSQFSITQFSEIQFEHGLALQMCNQHKEAYGVFNEILPNLKTEMLGKTWVHLGWSLFELHRPWKNAFEKGFLLLKGLELARGLINFGHFLAESGQQEEAHQAWLTALPLVRNRAKTRAFVLYNLAVSAQRLSQPEAENYFLELEKVTLNSKAADRRGAALNGIAMQRRTYGEWSRAEASYLRAKEIAKLLDLQTAYSGLARVYLLSNNPEKALGILEDALKHPDLAKNQLYAAKASVLLALNDLDGTRENLELAGNITLESVKWLLAFTKASLAQREGREADALRYLENLPVTHLHPREEAGRHPELCVLLEKNGLPAPKPLPYANGIVVRVEATSFLMVYVNNRIITVPPTGKIAELLVYLLENQGLASASDLEMNLFFKANAANNLLNGAASKLRSLLGWAESVRYDLKTKKYSLDPSIKWQYDITDARVKVVRWNDSAEPSPKLVKSVNRATPKYAM
jgi:hypothetical protein